MGNVDCESGSQTDGNEVLQKALGRSVCPGGTFESGSCSANITATTCVASGRARRLGSGNLQRELASNSLEVKFETIFKLFCQEDDCNTATAVAESVAAVVEETFVDNIATGQFVEALATAAQEAADEYAAENPDAPPLTNPFADATADDTTAVFDAVQSPTLTTLLEEIAADILAEAALSGDWYPNWGGDGRTTCLNDGKEPTYSECSSRC